MEKGKLTEAMTTSGSKKSEFAMAINTTNKPITKIENGEMTSRIDDVAGAAARERNERWARDNVRGDARFTREPRRDEARDETRDDDRE